MTHNSNTPDVSDEQISSDDRYAGVNTENVFVVYNTENASAWIQSNAAVSLAEMV